MSDAAKTASSLSTARLLLRDRPFVIAAIILGVTAVGWSSIRAALGVVTQKQPVPWPAGIVVTEKDHRLTTLPTRLGLYEMVKEYELTGDNDEDTLHTLGVATGFDNSDDRHARRRSNWYVTRVYADKRPSPLHKNWTLAAYYYTGGLDLVPHIPDNCLVAGAMTVLGTEVVKFSLPDLPEPWRQVQFCRTQYEDKSGQRHAEYYTFSLNGEPECSRNEVRLKLLSPFMRYSYFAKIQLGPFHEPVLDVAETDRAAEQFLRSAMPELLKVLPTPADVARLSAAG
jgi:hypothetical protein